MRNIYLLLVFMLIGMGLAAEPVKIPQYQINYSQSLPQNWNLGGKYLTGAPSPVISTGLATKGYVDIGNASQLNKTGGTMTGAIWMSSHQINYLANGTNLQDAVTLSQVQGLIGVEAYGATFISDGGKINHTLSKTPRYVSAEGSLAGTSCAITAITATNFTVDLIGVTTTQIVYWHARY